MFCRGYSRCLRKSLREGISDAALCALQVSNFLGESQPVDDDFMASVVDRPPPPPPLPPPTCVTADALA